MKNYGLNFLVVLVLYSNIHAAAKAVKKGSDVKTPLRMVVLIDDSEKPSDENLGAVTSTFAGVLHYKVAPFLVSTNILNTFLQRIDTRNGGRIHQALSNANFSLDEWDIYHKEDNALWLLIPKKFSFVTSSYELSLIPDVTLTVQSLKVNESEKVVTKDIYSFTDEVDTLLKELIAQKNVLGNKDFQEYIFTKRDVAEKLKEIEGYDDFLLKNKKDGIINAYASAMNSWNIFVMGHGFKDSLIVGLDLERFEKLSLFFNEVNTSMMFFESCFIGGSNRAHIVDVSKKGDIESFKKINYPFVLIGSGDTYVVNILAFEGLKDFFIKIEERGNPQWLFEALSYAAIGKSSSVFSDKVTFNLEQLNLGQLYVPGVGFSPITRKFSGKESTPEAKFIDESTLVLGDALTKKFAFEDQFIDVQLKRLEKKEKKSVQDGDFEESLQQIATSLDKVFRIDSTKTKVVLLNTPIIKMPISVKHFNSHYFQFLPMHYSKKYEAGGLDVKRGDEIESVYLFDSIEVEKTGNSFGIFNFIIESLGCRSTCISSMRFMIKELKGFNDFKIMKPEGIKHPWIDQLEDIFKKDSSDVILEDVVIQKMPFSDFSQVEIGFNGYITFRYKNSYWLLQIEQGKIRTRYHNQKIFVVPIYAAVWNKLGITDQQILTALSDKYALFNFLFSGLIQFPFPQENFQGLFDLTSKDEALVLLFVPEVLRVGLSVESKEKLGKVLSFFKEGQFEKAQILLKDLYEYFNKLSKTSVTVLDDEDDPTSAQEVTLRRMRLKKEQEEHPFGFEVVGAEGKVKEEEDFGQQGLDEYFKSKESSAMQLYKDLKSGAYQMFFGKKK